MSKKNSGGRHNDLLFKQQFQRGLQRQHSAGVAQGAYAMCKVIHDKAVEEGKTAEERLEWITNFCEKLLSTVNGKVEEVPAIPAEAQEDEHDDEG